jgi:hypothetical protein
MRRVLFTLLVLCYPSLTSTSLRENPFIKEISYKISIQFSKNYEEIILFLLELVKHFIFVWIERFSLSITLVIISHFIAFVKHFVGWACLSPSSLYPLPIRLSWKSPRRLADLF